MNTTVLEYTYIANSVQIVYDTYSSQGVVLIVGDFNAQLGPGWGPRRGAEQSVRGRVIHDFLMYNYMISAVVDQSCKGPACTLYPNDEV